MKKKFIAYVLIAGMLCFTGCGNSKSEATPTEDMKPVETETTEVETVGKDAEVASTDDVASTETKKQETTKEETTTKKEAETTKQEATTKKQETTTQKQVATTKPQPTTTKAQPTTTKPQPTTTKPQPTTTAQSTTTKSSSDWNVTQAAPGNKPSGFATVEISASINADKEANKIVESIISSNMSEYERVKAIHDWIVINVQYDYAGLNSNTLPKTAYNADGALCYKSAVCQGYAEAFQLLCAKAGVQAYMMYGEAGNSVDGWQSHAWNVVRINGEWYQVDCTWDDPLVNGMVVTGSGNLSYTYFLLTDKEMYYDHTLDTEYTKNVKVCTSTLFYGYSKYLTLDKKLESYPNASRVTTGEQLKDASKNYIKQGTNVFAIVFPTSVSDPLSVIQDGVVAGFTEKGMAGNIDISYAYEQVFDYYIFEVTVSIS